MELFGWISAVLFLAGYIPQIVRTFRLQTVDDLSIWLWVATFTAYLCGLIYGIWLDKYPLIFNYGAGLILSWIIILQWNYYRDPRRSKVRKIVRELLQDLRRNQ